MHPPTDCPQCGNELYPIARLRPEPTLPRSAKLLIGFSGVAAGAVYWGLAFVAVEVVFIPIPARGLSIVLLPVALVAGIPFVIVAYRLKKVMKLRCRKCAWRGQFALDTSVRRMRGRMGRCVHCGYDLAGKKPGVCPECGMRLE